MVYWSLCQVHLKGVGTYKSKIFKNLLCRRVHMSEVVMKIYIYSAVNPVAYVLTLYLNAQDHINFSFLLYGLLDIKAPRFFITS